MIITYPKTKKFVKIGRKSPKYIWSEIKPHAKENSKVELVHYNNNNSIKRPRLGTELAFGAGGSEEHTI